MTGTGNFLLVFFPPLLFPPLEAISSIAISLKWRKISSIFLLIQCTGVDLGFSDGGVP